MSDPMQAVLNGPILIPGFPRTSWWRSIRPTGAGCGEQLQQQLRSAIQQGRLPAGTALATDTDIGPRSRRGPQRGRRRIRAARGRRLSRGTSGFRERGCSRSARAGSRPSAPAARPDPHVRLLGGLPDPALFPRAEWLRHYRAALGAAAQPTTWLPGPAWGAAVARSTDQLPRTGARRCASPIACSFRRA